MTRTLVLVLLLVVDPAFAVDPDATATAAPSVHSDPSPEDTADVRRMAWTAYLRAERAQRLSSLRRYAARGRFPEKLDQPGFHHQFLDSRGTPCAVAFLIGHDGHWPLVRETAQADNDVVIAELRSGPLVDWVLTSGLTMEEVAVIQVPGFTPSAEPAGIAGPKGGVGKHPYKCKDGTTAWESLIIETDEDGVEWDAAGLGVAQCACDGGPRQWHHQICSYGRHQQQTHHFEP